MSKENEPAKLLLPYLQRADELQKHEPLVAYYCRLYAMERGLKIPQKERTKTTNSLLVSLINQLEKDKKSLELGPDDHLHVEGFALNVFAKADKQDRAGRADLNTAKTFYAASIFFEILNQFGELQPDLEQKQKYAAWKAADIRKALKEGRKPVPGPPGDERDISELSSAQNDTYDLQPGGTDSVIKPAPESDSVIKPGPESDSFSHVHDDAHYSANRPSPPAATPPPPPSRVPPSPPAATTPTPPHIPPSPPSYFSDEYPSHNDYSSHNFQQTPSVNISENLSYSPSYHHQPYVQEPQSHLPQHYPSHDVPSYSYPNFQSYPSFMESSLPSAPSHNPSYYQGADASYSTLASSSTANFSSNAQHSSSERNGTASQAAAAPTKSYEYDSNYQPPPDKIAEAHKAARFAVGALAFDDVSIAVDYLKKSLELLTNPSADQ
ncbi:protein HOMOLOG OF MAMMALIAN LYST-INTERACTING PROTEIN 5 isoform X1 [Nicotiana tabacum]|uniref:Protein HOMOLOG OF MAMMALIAN LYST-INTERACTING PROTEIN 5 n=3 Tax=Nicotiana TaxID=4085 RepID=A0A1S3XL90_TOBAC|nr:PREDICTED: vacuolar protein sorting-associated protein VTA1 homolog [Nicotiana sylvestris]XP_016440599.1 PREDICTED: protein HOMOLOG OF MAMMALIAN LYST-INTERACTING PROTEIN 5-like [Nicotiana tabacum]